MGDIMRHVHIHGKHEYAPCGFYDATYSAHNRAMNIATIRKSRGLTQTDLAEMTNITQPTISRLEKRQDFIHVTHIDA